jgi:hypothetical protein
MANTTKKICPAAITFHQITEGLKFQARLASDVCGYYSGSFTVTSQQLGMLYTGHAIVEKKFLFFWTRYYWQGHRLCFVDNQNWSDADYGYVKSVRPKPQVVIDKEEEKGLVKIYKSMYNNHGHLESDSRGLPL